MIVENDSSFGARPDENHRDDVIPGLACPGSSLPRVPGLQSDREACLDPGNRCRDDSGVGLILGSFGSD